MTKVPIPVLAFKSTSLRRLNFSHLFEFCQRALLSHSKVSPCFPVSELAEKRLIFSAIGRRF